MDESREVLERELQYHEKLYSGFAQQHFARPAVRALRAHMVKRLLRLLPTPRTARVLSLGCGIGDTEILLAPHVGELHGVDLSPAAIRQARQDSAGLGNTRFVEGSLDSIEGSFDLVFGIFFLHHLPDPILSAAPARIAELLAAGGRFYSLDPNRYRLSGAIGSLLVPHLMRKYQTADERELDPQRTAELFRRAGYETRVGYYDFMSSPLAGLFPGWRGGYAAARLADDVVTRIPLVQRAGSNFELVASLPPAASNSR
ncbi:MAG TPA: class I SAM-dependent methyltransferase [Bryobacteraceae bacterium]|jgi:SAM-dependent methyltransferase|nr:class I SAM-dependent methyltransferase [Bryobacteraceae bacterium]